MKTWKELNIDVDYSPSDPGCCNWFHERTTYKKEEMQPGMRLRYDDPGGLFHSISVVSLSEDGMVLKYSDQEYTLTLENTSKTLDKNGRNYTNFMLDVWLRVEE